MVNCLNIKVLVVVWALVGSACSSPTQQVDAGELGTCATGCSGGYCEPVSQQCVECLSDGHCAATAHKPRCHPAAHVCVTCLDGNDCMATPATPLCDEVSHNCVQCTQSPDCIDHPAGPICKQYECSNDKCRSDDDCSGEPAGSACDTESGACVECLNDSYCDNTAAVCLTHQQRCVECAEHQDCEGNPHGWFCGPDFSCTTVESCQTHDECSGHPDGEFCIFFTQACGQCLTEFDCDEGFICSEFICVEYHAPPPLTDEQCAAQNPSKPYSDNGICKECLTDEHCPAGDPFCAEGVCNDDCGTHEDCTDPDEPYCAATYVLGWECSECDIDEHCTDSARPYCSTQLLDNKCVECLNDYNVPCQDPALHCMAVKSTFSTMVDYICVECVTHSHCDTANGYFCNDEYKCQFEAIECALDFTCYGNSVLEQCLDGRCVQCESDWGCDDTLPSCDLASGRCVACSADVHCGGETPFCDTEKQRCVPCLDDQHCQYGYCHLDYMDCRACTRDEHCQSAEQPYCNANGSCVGCSPDSCVGHPDGEICLSESGACVECIHNQDCDEGYYCDETHVCRQEAVCLPFDTCAVAGVQYVCGSYIDGCGGTFDCGMCGGGESCRDGGRDCTCPRDALDAAALNDSEASAVVLGSFSDAPDSATDIRMVSIHSADDVDWYVLQILDEGLDGNPQLSVSLTISDREDTLYYKSRYEMALFYNCAAGGDAHTCDTTFSEGAQEVCGYNNIKSFDEITMDTECATSDDGGTLYIRVRKTQRGGRCDTYQLNVVVE